MIDRCFQDKIEQWISSRRKDIVLDLTRLVRIKSVSRSDSPIKPYGKGCRDVMDEMCRISTEHGLPSKNFGYQVGVAGNPEADIGIWGHLDVVEEGNGWLYPPYEGIIRDGFLIGRGSADNKAAVIAGLYTVLCLQELCGNLSHSVGVYFGCNEEAGMNDIGYFLSHAKAPALSLVADAGFPVCYGESGCLDVRLTSDSSLPEEIQFLEAGTAHNMVPGRAIIALETAESPSPVPGILLERRGATLWAEAKGLPGHTAFPQGSRNAIGVLAGYLLDAGLLPQKQQQLFSFLRELSADLKGRPLKISEEYGFPAPLYCVPTLLRMDGGRLALDLNLRYPAGAPVEDPRILEEKALLSALKSAAQELGFQLSVLKSSPPKLHKKRDDPLVQKLCRVYEETVGGAAKEPFIMAGGCYAGKLPDALGFGPGISLKAPGSFLPPGHGGAHGPDECVHIDSILALISTYVQAILELDKMDLNRHF